MVSQFRRLLRFNPSDLFAPVILPPTSSMTTDLAIIISRQLCLSKLKGMTDKWALMCHHSGM